MKEENSESKIKEEKGLTSDFVQVWRKCMKILLFLCENVPQWEDTTEVRVSIHFQGGVN